MSEPNKVSENAVAQLQLMADNGGILNELVVALGYCIGFITGEHSTTDEDKAEVLECAHEAIKGATSQATKNMIASGKSLARRGQTDMSDEQAHTPVPWQCIPSDDYFDTYHVWPGNLPIPDFSSDDARHPQELANAYFIERACNSYRKLLNALEWIVWEINEGCGDKLDILTVARAALGR